MRLWDAPDAVLVDLPAPRRNSRCGRSLTSGVARTKATPLASHITLEESEQLPDSGRKVLVADTVNFDWRTAPDDQAITNSFEDFYREVEPTVELGMPTSKPARVSPEMDQFAGLFCWARRLCESDISSGRPSNCSPGMMPKRALQRRPQ